MKINPNGISGIGKFDAPQKKDGVKAARPAAQVDKIEISGAEQPGTQKFIEQLKSQIMKDVRAGADPAELHDLKQQVASGEYELNVAEIARRILCDFD